MRFSLTLYAIINKSIENRYFHVFIYSFWINTIFQRSFELSIHQVLAKPLIIKISEIFFRIYRSDFYSNFYWLSITTKSLVGACNIDCSIWPILLALIN
ncbi:hypothetical protein DMX11_22005 [Pseudomonas sp. LB-090624]|nr:hypothetical protein DMX11_22005 [Pseudomonas sp. LB-090624]